MSALPKFHSKPIALSNEAGEIVESFIYDGHYGKILNHYKTEDTMNPYGYTGREIELPDLYYYRARYYDPGMQRFISVDPIEWESEDYHWYRYVGNDPVNFVDPSGLEGCNKTELAKDTAENVVVGLATHASTSLGMGASALGVLTEGDNAVNASKGLHAILTNSDKYEKLMEEINNPKPKMIKKKKESISDDTKNYCACMRNETYELVTKDLDPIKRAGFCKIQVMENPDSNTTCP